MDSPELVHIFTRLLEDLAGTTEVRRIEAGGSIAELWESFEASGFLDALTPEAAGGADLTLNEVAPLWEALGRYLVAAPVAETMIARALLARAGMPAPRGAIVLAPTNKLRSAAIPLARVANWALVESGERLILVPLDPVSAAATGVHNSLAATLSWSTEPAGPSFAAPSGGLRPLGAIVRAAAVAGAADRVLEMTVAYANERVQFAKPIAKQQVIQQQLAVMAQQAVAARIAAQIGCASGFPPELAAAAVAKQIASRAAVHVANMAHAVHGAIGISEEYDLQLFTRRLHEWRQADGSEAYWSECLGRLRLEAPDASSVDFIRARVCIRTLSIDE
jgi:acyl-CoA dehydrogenase